MPEHGPPLATFQSMRDGSALASHQSKQRRNTDHWPFEQLALRRPELALPLSLCLRVEQPHVWPRHDEVRHRESKLLGETDSPTRTKGMSLGLRRSGGWGWAYATHAKSP